MSFEIKTIKSYFTFLSRNKTYTFINAFGFSLSLMFVIIIGQYAKQEYGVDKSIDKAERIFSVGMKFGEEFAAADQYIEGTHWRVQRMLSKMPGVEMTCGATMAQSDIMGPTGDMVMTDIMFADSTFFRMFSIPVVEGDRNHVLDQPNAVVVSEAYARRMFGNVDPVGRPLYFEDDTTKTSPMRVTGVFTSTEGTSFKPTDMITRFELVKSFNSSLTSEQMNNATGSNVFLLAKEGVDLTTKEAQLDKVQRDGGFWIYQSKKEAAVKTKVVRFSDRYFSKFQTSSGTGGENARRGDKKIVNILFAVGLVILVFSIINYVNLTVAQASSRAKEMATRRLLGSQRSGIMTRLIAESMLMCLLSLIVGVVLAVAALPYAAQLLKTTMEQSALFTPGNILMAIAFVVVVGMLSGIIPAVVISRARPIDVVRGTFRMKMKMRFSKVFIVFQNIMTIMMIGCALTMVLQVRHLVNAPLGYNHEHVLSLPASDDSTQLANYTAELRKMACVENVSLCMGHPLNGGNNNTVTYDDGKTLSFQIMYGDEHFMPLLGLHLLRDNHVDDEEGVFVNRQTLRELGLPLDAKYIMMRDKRLLVRGVLADFHIRGIMDAQHPVLLFIQKNIKWPWGILVKVNGDETEAYNKINELFKVTFKHDVSDFTNIPYLDQAIRYMYSQAIRMSTIVTLFAAIAIIISLLGLVAMSTYFIQQRRKEIAIRKVFGSTSRQIYMRLLRTFMLYVVVAFVPAVLLIHHFMTDWLSTYSYRIDLAWWIYLVAGLFCLVVSLIAVMAQSYKAANENPAGNVKAE